ncbi:MAG: hypothetical protein ACTFAK_03660 [Candidatus Electronema sp. VV]
MSGEPMLLSDDTMNVSPDAFFLSALWFIHAAGMLERVCGCVEGIR